MLINLLANAIKFTYNGHIKVKVGFNNDQKELVFKVEDTGIGIKSESKARLFTMFGKLEDTASINTTGIGLGLSICRKIIDALGGKIYLDDSNVIGTTIIFTVKC